jgi:hypothetical protein
MSWKKFHITATRLIEEEACFFVHAPTYEEAEQKAMDMVGEVADLVWERTDCEPHTYTIEKCESVA